MVERKVVGSCRSFGKYRTNDTTCRWILRYDSAAVARIRSWMMVMGGHFHERKLNHQHIGQWLERSPEKPVRVNE